jgi:hypothetical protein
MYDVLGKSLQQQGAVLDMHLARSSVGPTFAEMTLRLLTLEDKSARPTLNLSILSHLINSDGGISGLDFMYMHMLLADVLSSCTSTCGSRDIPGPRLLPIASQYWRGLHVSYQNHPGVR